MPKISVVINTKNEEKNIKRCLDSVKGFADEMLVVDMNSEDNTVSLAKKAGATVINYKSEHGYVEPARNFAISKAKGDWILILDADEELSEKTKEILKKVIEKDQFDVFYLPRKNIIFGKWIEHTGWWPDYQARLFRNGYIKWSDVIHSQPVAKGRLNYLPPKEEYAITHHNYTSVEQFLEKLNRYSTISSRGDFAKVMSVPITPAQTLSKFFEEFLSRYFAHDGINDGVHGAGLSLLQATYELSYFLKRWELGGHPNASYDKGSGIRQLRKFQKDLGFWIADYNAKNTAGLNQVYWRIRRWLKI